MEFISDELSRYVEEHCSAEPEVLKKIKRETHLKVLMPRMLSGHVQGRFLSMISHMIRPARILEVGTFTGYSAISLAEGLTDDGILHTIEVNAELESMLLRVFSESGYGNKIRLHIGNAADLISQIDEEFDMVFLDADKINYDKYYELCLPKVRRGGFILADNVLWSGKILNEKEIQKDKDTAAIHAFNEKIAKDERVEKMLLPLRDGLFLIRKK